MGTSLRRAALALLVGLAAAAGCGNKPSEPEPGGTEAPAEEAAMGELTVEFAGCVDSQRSPATCTVREQQRKLRLWVDAAQAPVFAFDGIPVDAQPTPSGGELDGWRVILTVPEHAKELSVRAAAASWTLALRDAPTPLIDAMEARLPAQNDPGRASALAPMLDEIIASVPRAQGVDQVMLLRLASLIAWDLGRADQAISHGRNAIATGLDQELTSLAIIIAQNLPQFVLDQPAEVSWLLELQTLYMPQIPDASVRARWHYALGFQHFETGDFGAARSELQRSATLARRLGLVQEELAAVSVQVCALAILGRDDERRQATTRILELAQQDSANACDNAAALGNVAWALVVAPGNARATDDPGRILEQVLAYYEPGGGCDIESNPAWAHLLHQAHLYLAIDALLRTDVAVLRERVAWFDGRQPAPRVRGWVAYLSADLALREGDPRKALEHLRAVGRDASDLLLSWQAMVLRGRALEQVGARERALTAYLDAESLLDDVTRNVPIDEGREGLGAGMHASASRAIALLIEDGHPERAARVARLSRSRALRPAGKASVVGRLSPDLRREYHDELERYRALSEGVAKDLVDMWRLPSDQRVAMQRRHAGTREQMRSALVHAYQIVAEHSADGDQELSPPGPGETWLLYHPHDGGWFGFAMSSDQIIARDLGSAPDLADPTATSKWLLDPFASAIQDAAELHVLAMGRLLDVRFEALPFGGATLLAAVPVAYALDLGSPRRGGIGTSALVVGDPADRSATTGGELPRARQEAERAMLGLQRAGYEVTTLLGADARQADIISGLGSADWFHYAGHGTSEGFAGWDSALPLAGEGRLTLADVLALPSAPRAVVLSACETAATDASKAAGGMHLAGAFVMAGASFAIATHGTVDDDAAAELSAALYELSSELRTATGPELLRAVLLRQGDGASPFRVWIP